MYDMQDEHRGGPSGPKSMTGTGISSGRCCASGCRMSARGSSVLSRVSAETGTNGSVSRANLGDELAWSMDV